MSSFFRKSIYYLPFFFQTFTGSFWRIERFGDEFRVRRNSTRERSISGVSSLCEHLSWSGKWDNTNRGSYSCHDVCVETDHSKSNYVDTNYWEFVVMCSGTSNKFRSLFLCYFHLMMKIPTESQCPFVCCLSPHLFLSLYMMKEGILKQIFTTVTCHQHHKWDTVGF